MDVDSCVVCTQVRLSTQAYHPPSEENLVLKKLITTDIECISFSHQNDHAWSHQGKQFMHLTNYSINKFSMSYDHDDRPDKGSKRYVWS